MMKIYLSRHAFTPPHDKNGDEVKILKWSGMQKLEQKPNGAWYEIPKENVEYVGQLFSK